MPLPQADRGKTGTRDSSPVEVLVTGPRQPGDAPGLDEIVRPLSTQEFLDTRYRDKRPILFRSENPRFASLCTWEELNELLPLGFGQGRMSLVRDGRPIAERYYTTPDFGLGWRRRRVGEVPLDDRRITAFLRKGATVILRGIEDLHPPVRPLVDAFEEALGSYTGVNLYASWAATRGFATHWDDHDVFVLQVAGAKRWHLYGETRRFPFVQDSEANVKPPREKVWSEMLGAGDVLYIPRGWWHDARTEAADGADGAGSLHLTCGVISITGLDLVAWLTGRLARHEAFRRDLPLPSDETGDAHYAALREIVLEELRGDVGRKFRHHMRSTWSERPRTTLGAYIEPWKSPDWERHGIRLRGARHATLERNADGDAVLEANGYRWTFDPRCMELIAPLVRGETVRAGTFREAVPEGAPASLADAFLELLVERGIAYCVPPDSASGPER